MSIHVISCRRGLHEKLLVSRLVMKFFAVDDNRISVRMPAFAELINMGNSTCYGKSYDMMDSALELGYQATRRGLNRKPYIYIY